MLRTTTRRINKLTVVALVVFGFAAICVAQQQPSQVHPSQEQQKAVGSLCNEFRKIRDLIPRQLLAMITAKHYRYDAKFRHAMKFIPSQEFANAAKAFEESAGYQNILLQFRKAGVQTTDIASIGGILNCLMVTGQTQQQEHQNGRVKLEKVHTEDLIGDEMTKKAQQIKDEQKLQEPHRYFEEIAQETIKEVKEKKYKESQPNFEEKIKKQIAEQEFKLRQLKKKFEEQPEKNIAEEEYKLQELQQKFEEKTAETKDEKHEIKKMMQETQNEIAQKADELKELYKKETKIKEEEISYNNNNQIDYHDDNWLNDDWMNAMDFDDDNDDFFEVESNKPIRFARSARSRATTSTRPFYKDVMRAIPRQKLHNLLVQDLAKNPELAMFYKLLRSLAFRRHVQRSLRSASVRAPLTVMKKNFIDIPRLTAAIFKVFSWGPRRN